MFTKEKKPDNKIRDFTLIELLIVIAIISILAAMLMPALNEARNRARLTSCSSNLRQVGMAIQMYETDYNRLPPYLSALYPSFLDTSEIYLCPVDHYDGLAGSKPPSPPWSDPNQFPETNELPPGDPDDDYKYDGEEGVGNQAGVEAWEQEFYSRPEYEVTFLGEPAAPHEFRNPDLMGASYIYEFSVAAVPSHGTTSPTPSDNDYWGKYSDIIGNDVTTWHDFKKQEIREWGNAVPVVRCFYHTSYQSNPEDVVINLGYHHAVYRSGLDDPWAWWQY